jgi:glycosyltransferase involved in cell wall biosynthesis
MTGVQDLSGTTLTVTFSAGVSLHTWRRIGSLEREMAIYRQMEPHLQQINFVTYGGPWDALTGRQLQPLKILASLWTRSASLTERLVWMTHRRALQATDIIKTNQIPGSDVAVRLSRRCGAALLVRCGYVWSLNRSRETDNREDVERVRRIERDAFRASDLAVVTTEANRSYVVDAHDLDPAKVRVIPNYVDTDHFTPIASSESPPGPGRLVFVGRLAPEKNLSALLSALYQLKQDGAAPHLLLVGDGPLRRALRQQAAALGLEVDFLGSVPHYELPALFHSCDAFVLPSLYEGHPKSLLEAMACGLPVIGCDVPGVREEIVDGQSGVLCATSAEALAAAIRRVFDDGDLRQRLGGSAAEYVRSRYSLTSVADSELALLRELTR